MGMWNVVSLLPTWMYVLILLILALYLYVIWPYLTNTINLPGPQPKAVFGNAIEIRKKGMAQADVDNIKTYGKVYLAWNGRVSAITISHPEMIKQILVKDFQNFTDRPIPVALSPIQKNMVNVIGGDHWKFVRSILTPAFSSGKMRGMMPLIHTCVDNLLHNMTEICEAGKSFELEDVMGAFSMDVIAAIGFGIDTQVQKNPDDIFLKMAKRPFRVQMSNYASAFLSFLCPSLIPLLEAMNWTISDKISDQYFKETLTQTILQRKLRVSGRKDILQLLLDNNLADLQEARSDGDVDIEVLKFNNVHKSQKLTDDEVVSQAFVFLLGGYGTTASSLAYVGFNLALNQSCQDKLIDEIDTVLKGERPTYDNVLGLPYLEMCMTESLRMFPITAELRRVCRTETVINGCYIPENQALRIPVYAIQHDPEYWPEPENFDPERFTPEAKAKRNPYVYLPFGIGPRNCVGMRLAKLESKMALTAILQKFRFVRSLDTQVPLKIKKEGLMQTENGVWLKLESRH